MFCPMASLFTQSKSRVCYSALQRPAESLHPPTPFISCCSPPGSFRSCHTGFFALLYQCWILLPQGLCIAVRSFRKALDQPYSILAHFLTLFIFLINVIISVRLCHASSLFYLIFLSCIFYHVTYFSICLLSVFLQVKYMLLKRRIG